VGLRILADRNIADVEAAFAALGEVEAVRSTEITPDRVRDVDLLLVEGREQAVEGDVADVCAHTQTTGDFANEGHVKARRLELLVAIAEGRVIERGADDQPARGAHALL